MTKINLARINQPKFGYLPMNILRMHELTDEELVIWLCISQYEVCPFGLDGLVEFSGKSKDDVERILIRLALKKYIRMEGDLFYATVPDEVMHG